MPVCGPIELAFTLCMMREGFLAPTLNLEDVDPRCAMLRHTPGLIEAKTDIAAVQNFAFGGVNTCLIVKKGPDAG